MIDPKYSNVSIRTIAVPIGRYQLPKECILCGDADSQCIEVPYEKVSVFFNLYSVKSFTVLFPLCDACLRAATEKENKRRNVFNLVAIVGLGLAGVPYGLLKLQSGSTLSAPPPLWVNVLAAVGGVLIIAAFAMMKLKDKTFPIHARQTQDLQYFTFPDDASMKRFVAANATAEGDESR